jgi:nicotinate-nucleotide adenylyltransferase
VRYCIFGGSFDPPHEGHRYLARSARETLALDKVIWVPSPDPPHKTKPSTPFADRLAMVRLAIAGMEGNEASAIEETLGTPSYSIHTIAALKALHKALHGKEHHWFFLIGADNWEIFTSWHRWEEVLKEATLVVFPRGGRDIGTLPPGVVRLDLPEMMAESSEIRSKLEETGDFDAAGVLPEIRDYIQSHGLYGQGRTDVRRNGT